MFLLSICNICPAKAQIISIERGRVDAQRVWNIPLESRSISASPAPTTN